MLNKRIKSLLIAGLLVFSMVGGVFAEGETLPAEGTIEVEYPDFEGKSFKDYSFQDGNIKLRLYRDYKSEGVFDYRADVIWTAENVKVTNVKFIYKDESSSERNIKLPGETAEGENCYDAVADGENYKAINIADSIEEKELIEVQITYINKTKSDKPVTPEPEPEEEDEEIKDPATGDASIMPLVATAVISAAGLYLVNRKDEE